ncbi:hypothetical protein [Vulgatibacter sp.]|uniref:hypothetical protein n=1 Tax=Vulgatibacter sp. TaxID=1971226 RepID=UPI003565CA97
MTEAFPKIRDALALQRRLSTVAAELAVRERLAREQRWLDEARTLLDERTNGADELLARAAALPEGEELRTELLAEAKLRWIDAAQTFHATVTRTFGPRAPVVEALFPHADFEILRRKGFDDYHDAVLRFLATAYVERTLAEEERVHAHRDALVAASERLQQLREPQPAEDDAALRREVDDVAAPLDLVLRQVRHLAEAALLPAPDLLERAALEPQGRRRTARRASTRAG